MKNWKGVLTILLMSVLSLGFGLPAFAAETEALQLKSKSAVLMDAGTGTILYEKNSHEAMPPASVTKVMTLLLIYEAEAAGQFGWEETVQVSEHAASMGGSQVFLEPGETQTAAELTKCIAIASANDAAVAMAEFVAGSEEAFVERMNRKAEELGMQETHFVNACGLDVDGHETSAYDIALMSRELMTKFPEVQKYTTTWQDTIIHKTRKGESEFGLTNTNKLIKWYEGATGLKTGSTARHFIVFPDGGAQRAAPDWRCDGGTGFQAALSGNHEASGLRICQLQRGKGTACREGNGAYSCDKGHGGQRFGCGAGGDFHSSEKGYRR